MNGLMLASEQAEMSFEYVSAVVITGMVVVFAALILLVIVLYVMGGIFSFSKSSKQKKTERQKAELEAQKTQAKAQLSVPSGDGGVDEEIAAVIMAAVSAMGASAGKKLAVRSIKASKGQRPAWSNAGLIENTRPF